MVQIKNKNVILKIVANNKDFNLTFINLNEKNINNNSLFLDIEDFNNNSSLMWGSLFSLIGNESENCKFYKDTQNIEIEFNNKIKLIYPSSEKEKQLNYFMFSNNKFVKTFNLNENSNKEILIKLVDLIENN